MYTLDYLNCFIENLDLPEASRASLRENCETLVTTPGAIDELVSAETLLFKDYGIDGAYGAEWKPIVPHMDALSERTGLHRHVVDFLFLALDLFHCLAHPFGNTHILPPREKLPHFFVVCSCNPDIFHRMHNPA